MYTRQITSEETYTLAEAKRIINAERQVKREEFLCKVKKKLLGVLSLLIVVAEFTMCYFNIIDEGGAFIIMLPLGLYLLFTKERVVY